MLPSRSRHQPHHLPDDVLVSVQEVTRAVAPPDPQLPQWLARVLPKSGLAGIGAFDKDVGIEEELEEEVDIEAEEDEERVAMSSVSFELRRGEGLGLLGADNAARRALLGILTGAIPPSTGRVLIRGSIAPLVKADLMKLTTPETGKHAVFLAARYLHWPQSLLRKRWKEILEFARLEELADLPPEKHRAQLATRLLLSAALHLDVDVYLFDDANLPHKFAVRCVERLEQRQREGAAVIQSARTEIETVGRLCNEVLWLEDGAVAHRGRPVDVAVAVEKGRKEKLHPLSTPVLVSLVDSGPVSVESEGGTIEFELHSLRANLTILFSLRLPDWEGDEARLSQPEAIRVADPGLYRLRIFFPPGLLPDGGYEARLFAEIGVRGSEPARPRELLAFDIVASDQNLGEPGDEGLTFDLVPDENELEGEPETVEWRVSRTPS